MVPADVRALVLIGACGRIRPRICLRSSSARLVPEPWCPLVHEPWCSLVRVVESVPGFASVAQVAACCSSPDARWCSSLGAHRCPWSSPFQDLPPWLRCPPGARALMPIGARALVPIAACGRVRVRICLRSSGAAWCSSPRAHWYPRLGAQVKFVSGFASIAQVPAWCPSPGAR